MLFLKILSYIFLVLLILELVYIAFVILSSLIVNTSKDYTKNSKYFRGLLYSGTWELLLFGRVKVHITGAEKLPKDSRFLIISNHRSKFDPMTTWYVFRKYNIAYISKPENFNVPFFGRIIRPCCFLPIIRGNPRLALPTIEKAIDLLKADEVSIGIYPEGTRSQTEEMLPFHNGVFKIAQRAEVPVVICAIQGTEKIHKNFPWRRTHVYIDVLDVIPVEKLLSQKTFEIADYSKALIEKKLNESKNKQQAV
ncbi:MAG: 1-acyl-sn-glycerol-3-phosphate acyltransferase [Treponema sp.]|nr:1-acyl-sn-glycerol-3-phosphate acyltransferase [Treponema sp.]